MSQLVREGSPRRYRKRCIIIELEFSWFLNKSGHDKFLVVPEVIELHLNKSVIFYRDCIFLDFFLRREIERSSSLCK